MMLLLHVLILLLSGGSARVVQDFESECGQFFAIGKSPTIFPDPQYRQICQTLNNMYYYATFYDTNKKIPVYSAYKFEGLKDCTRQNRWYIEPQLDDNNGSPNMQFNEDVKKQILHQAVNEDYENSGYDRGHLAPVFQANSQSCAYATFTLTNAAPQNLSFNRGQWKKLEGNIAKELSNQCLPNKYSVYIVTGVVPGIKNIKNNVTVPSHFWTAYCCLDQNNKCQISGGFIGENMNIPPQSKTVNALQIDLAKVYNVTYFELFDNSTAKKQKSQKALSKLSFIEPFSYNNSINLYFGNLYIIFLCLTTFL